MNRTAKGEKDSLEYIGGMKGEEIDVYNGRMDGQMDGRWDYRLVDWKVWKSLDQQKYTAVEERRYGLMGWRVKTIVGESNGIKECRG